MTLPLNDRERLTRLETQMETLSKNLERTMFSVDKLMTALNQMQGGAIWALRLGSALALGVAGLWAVVSWAFSTFGRH